MTDWFRSWHGAPTDPKWVLIARKAKVSPAIASAIAWALFDHASQTKPRGDVSRFDAEVYAAWGGLDDEAVFAVIQAMRDRGMIRDDGMLANWSKRQPEREDGAAERARAWREARRTHANARERTTGKPNATEPHRDREDTDTEKNIQLDLQPVLVDAPAEKPLEPAAPSPKAPAKTMGSRLADGWKPSDEGRAFARERLGTGRRAHEELAKFTDHWRGKAGAAGRKVDWEATWRNWVRKAAETQPRAPPARGGSYVQALIDATTEIADEQQQPDDTQFGRPAA